MWVLGEYTSKPVQQLQIKKWYKYKKAEISGQAGMANLVNRDYNNITM